MKPTDFLDFIGENGLEGLDRLSETMRMINVDMITIQTHNQAITLHGKVDGHPLEGSGVNLENAICEYWERHGRRLEDANKRIRAEVEAQKVGPASAA